MKNIIKAYLYANKNCPLPSVGTLYILPGKARFLPGDNQISAPVPFVELVQTEIDPNSFIRFISEQKEITTQEAKGLLDDYCSTLNQMLLTGESVLPAVGSFYKDESDVLRFRSVMVNAAYLPDVKAERVIHPDVAHQMLVGDTQTDTMLMSEMLRVEEKARPKWWIAAVVFTLIAAGAILFYYSRHAAADTGKGTKVDPKTETKTYNTNQ